MSRHARVLTLVGVMTAGLTGASLAADEPPAEFSTARDLAAVIALQGLPCGKVVSTQQRGEGDYVASCADGNRYRVFLNGEGRVIVEKQD